MGIFSGFLDKKNESVLGVDIGSSAIKIVQLKKKGEKVILETYGELALGPYAGSVVGQATVLDEVKLSQALKDLLSEKEVAITTNICGVAIPFRSSLLSIIELPAASQKELTSMVPIEARKYIPVPISEVIIDWSVIPKDSDDDNENKDDGMGKKLEILLAAIHTSVISQYSSMLDRANLKSKFFEIEVFSTMRAVVDEPKKPVLVFDMGSSTTKLYIIERGLVKMSHTINKGSQEITSNIARTLDVAMEDAEVMKRNYGMGKTLDGIDLKEIAALTIEHIFSETVRFLFEYQKKNNRNVVSIILVGGGSTLKGFRDFAAERFKVNVVAGDPFSKVEAPAFLEGVLKMAGPEFTVAMGTALRCIKELE